MDNNIVPKRKTNGIIKVDDYVERATYLEEAHKESLNDEKHREFLRSQTKYGNDRYAKDKDIKKGNNFFMVFILLTLILVGFAMLIFFYADILSFTMTQMVGIIFAIITLLLSEKVALGLYLGLKYKEKNQE